jgi:hypothetical protein
VRVVLVQRIIDQVAITDGAAQYALAPRSSRFNYGSTNPRSVRHTQRLPTKVYDFRQFTA